MVHEPFSSTSPVLSSHQPHLWDAQNLVSLSSTSSSSSQSSSPVPRLTTPRCGSDPEDLIKITTAPNHSRIRTHSSPLPPSTPTTSSSASDADTAVCVGLPHGAHIPLRSGTSKASSCLVIARAMVV